MKCAKCKKDFEILFGHGKFYCLPCKRTIQKSNQIKSVIYSNGRKTINEFE